MRSTLPLFGGWNFRGVSIQLCLRLLCYLFVRCGPYSSLCCGLGYHALHNTLGVYNRFWGLLLVCVYLVILEHRPKGDIRSHPIGVRGGGGG